MNIEIKKLSFKDYVISRVEMEKIKLLISLGVIWAYVIYDMERKGNGAGLQTILKEYTLPALVLSLGINIFVYLTVYFFSYKKALKESGVFFVPRKDGRPGTTWDHVTNPAGLKLVVNKPEEEEPNFKDM